MKSFIIPSLLLAGFSDTDLNTKKENLKEVEPTAKKYWNLMERKLPITLAGHKSHGSHSSHASHRSSSGGSITVPITPKYVPKPKVKKPTYVAPKVNNSTSPESVLPKVKGNSAQFKRITTRVQMYLYAFGFYNGALTGVADMTTKAAIVKFQKSRNLKITGKIDNSLLKVMNVSTE